MTNRPTALPVAAVPDPGPSLLDLRWRDALRLVQPFAQPLDLRMLILSTEVVEAPEWRTRLWLVTKHDGYLTLAVSSHVLELPRVEAAEILTAASLDCMRRLEVIYYQQLIRRIGVVLNPLILNPANRWRLIALYQDYTDLPVFTYEDRPRCKLCHIPVATGASAEGRKDLHENCQHYARTVLLPAARAARQQNLSTEIDK